MTESRDAVKGQLLLEGIELGGRHVDCASVQRSRPRSTTVTILMPFEMPNDLVTPILAVASIKAGSQYLPRRRKVAAPRRPQGLFTIARHDGYIT